MVSDEVLIDDQSHYEVSLTAGQAFVAFVLLLLSLAATFAFGLMIGRGQADERLVVRKEPAVINEGALSPRRRTSASWSTSASATTTSRRQRRRRNDERPGDGVRGARHRRSRKGP